MTKEQLLVRQKICALKDEKKSDKFIAIFKEINEMINQDYYFDVVNYRKTLHVIGEKAYELQKRHLNSILSAIKRNLFKVVDDTSVMRSILLISHYSTAHEATKFFEKLYKKRPDLHWVLPMGLNYVNLDALGVKEESIAKYLIHDLLASMDEYVVDEIGFYRERLEGWAGSDSLRGNKAGG